MSLTLHYHPLSSFCWKVLIPLYENGTPFKTVLVNLGDPASRAPFVALWPMGKFPVLQDQARGETVPESSAIIDYLDCYYAGAVHFTPADSELARRTRLWDRFLDLHIHLPMQKITGDRNRPADQRDPLGVAQARQQISDAYRIFERELATRDFAAGDAFSLADCAAAPALYYGNKVVPFGAAESRIAAYLARLEARPSFARVLEEAAPYFHLFPSE